MKYLKYIIIVICIIVMIFSIRGCYDYKNKYQNQLINIEVLKDTLSVREISNGSLVYNIGVLLGELKDIKDLNENLYSLIHDLKKELKIKLDVINGISFDSYVENDTIYQTIEIQKFNNDTIIQPFSFIDSYRELCGEIGYYPKYDNANLKIEIQKDITYLDYTILMDSNNQIYITSSNPNVRINKLNAFSIPKLKRNRFGIGIQTGVGTNFREITPYIGIGIQYNLFSF